VPPNAATSKRTMFAVGVGVAAALYVYAYALANPDFVSDFDQVWAGAAALWQGRNPYEVVGPRGAFLWKWPLYYPLPALLIAAPFGLLPVVAARMLFASVSSSLLAFAITREGFSRWPLFISLAFVVNVELVQWSSLLAAAAMIPALSWVAVAKPNIGVAIAAAAQTRRTLAIMVGGSLILTVISFLVLPDWVSHWLTNVRSATHFKPLLVRPGGFLLLLGLLRWRRPEARLLVALASTPLTPTFYDPVLLFLVARSFREALALAAGTICLYFVVAFVAPRPNLEDWGAIVATASVWLLYLPCVFMVLRRANRADASSSASSP
jgi:hypothetical protein